MRLSFSSILVLSCFLHLGLFPKQAIANPSELTPPTPTQLTVLNLNAQGPEVQVLQIQLKALGYYRGVIDGQYGLNTQNAVIQFQKDKNLRRVDGVADSTTRKALEITLTGKDNDNTTATNSPTPPVNAKVEPKKQNYVWWSMMGFGSLGSIAIFLYWKNRLNQVQTVQQMAVSEQKLLSASNDESLTLTVESTSIDPVPLAPKLLPPAKTPLLAKIDAIEQLITDLGSSDPTKRRKAVWVLGQQGDSRAIQPLLDLMIDADSHQHGLILSALTEIGLRTLKPMNRALAISMQNDSPQVRQNAIRDLARIYDMMGQMSHILRHAMEDTNPEVQATAKYALNHINRMRIFPEHSPGVADFSNQHG
ncbi:MAG TPA: peptidoglycan-binding protein [Nostocaceae cyanobacterium]|nr:peptidoglycan-binding protein [Nostocaceae cyanobacterium]